VDLIDLYGADALRFFLASQAGQRQDIRMKPIRDGKQEQVELARNFCNKIWNASRFAIMNLEGAAVEGKKSLTDRWILSRLNATANTVNHALDTYNLDDAARALYAFFWDDFCDWYIEAAKPALQGENAEATRHVLAHTLDQSLRLLHPILPYLTEAIWQNVPGVKERAGVEYLMFATFPEEGATDPQAEADFAIVQEITRAIRTIQAENQLKKGGEAFVLPSSDHAQTILRENQPLIEFLTRCTLRLEPGAEEGFLTPTPYGDVRLQRPEASAEDIAAEKARIEKDLEKIAKDLNGLTTRLSDPNFAARAPEAVLAKTRAQADELTERQGKLQERLRQLGA
jgi:valyl-tRNA synthetase